MNAWAPSAAPVGLEVKVRISDPSPRRKKKRPAEAGRFRATEYLAELYSL